MLPDYHVHTPLCQHARGTPSECVLAARRCGLPEVCFTDHGPVADGYDPTNRMTPAEFPAYVAAVREAGRKGPPPEVRLGIEADYYPRGLDHLSRWLPAQGFDYVLGSVHYIGDWGFDQMSLSHVWHSVDVVGTWREYFRLVGELAASGLYDAVAHLDLPKKFGHRPDDDEVREMARPALDRIARAGMAIEVNTSGLRKPVGEIYPSPLLLELAREHDIPILFGSDAHAPEHVGYAFDRALTLARDAGYTEYVRYRGRRPERVPLPAPDSTHSDVRR